jgi:hypothetical protein
MAFSDVLRWFQHSQAFLLLINFFLTVFVLILTARLSKKLKRYRFLIKDNEDKELEQVLVNLSEKVDENGVKVAQIATDFGNFKEQNKFDLQKWALIRFKAFNNTGGDQSFALALMNEYRDGLIISSIFGREESIVYCKPIKNGASVYPLSQEEQEAINQAASKIK